MTSSFEDYLTAKDILADALVAVGDEEAKNYPLGWYIRQVRTGLEKLNYNAPFIQTFVDVDVTSNLIIPVPKGVWDTIDLFLWKPEDNATCDDLCKISSAVRLFWKRNFHTNGYLEGYTARHHTSMSDFYLAVPYQYDAETFFYNVNMGSYYLSDACIDYPKLRIVYNGVPSAIDKVKFIPPFCREYLIAWVTEKTFAAMKAKDIKYRTLWADAKQDLYERRGTEPSKYDEAESLIKRLDKKQWNDLTEYLGQMNY